jgi:hypothetical protein
MFRTIDRRREKASAFISFANIYIYIQANYLFVYSILFDFGSWSLLRLCESWTPYT